MKNIITVSQAAEFISLFGEDTLVKVVIKAPKNYYSYPKCAFCGSVKNLPECYEGEWFANLPVTEISAPKADGEMITIYAKTARHIMDCRITKLSAPLPSAHGKVYYRADHYESTDGGKTFYDAHYTDYFRTLEEAENYKALIERANKDLI